MREHANGLAGGTLRLLALVFGTRFFLAALAYVWHASLLAPNALDAPFSREPIWHVGPAFGIGDVVGYVEIARHGYTPGPFTAEHQANWAYYPLWPLVLRGCWLLFGRAVLPGVIVATLLFAAAAVALYALFRLDTDDRTALRAASFVVIFPASYFASRPGPESLFLVLVAGCFLAARTRRWGVAALLAALATLTRVQGVLLLAPLLYMYWRDWRRGAAPLYGAAWFALVPAALGGFFYHLWRLTGDPLASIHIQKAWDNAPTYPFAWLIRFAEAPRVVWYYGWDMAPVSMAATLLAVAAAIAMWWQREVPREYALFTALNVYLVVGRNNTNAALRYMLCVFPLFLYLALLLRGRPWARTAVTYVFGGLQVMYFLAFTQMLYWAQT
jgi:hypothetical protein